MEEAPIFISRIVDPAARCRGIRDQPGPCPICGMALEHPKVTLDAPNPELTGMTRRLWVAAASEDLRLDPPRQPHPIRLD